jgi:hypothetical protein
MLRCWFWCSSFILNILTVCVFHVAYFEKIQAIVRWLAFQKCLYFLLVLLNRKTRCVEKTGIFIILLSKKKIIFDIKSYFIMYILQLQTFIHVITVQTEDLWRKEWANINVCFSIEFSCIQTWYQGTEQCRYFMFILNVSFYAHFRRFSISNNCRQKCKRCFLVELENINICFLITFGYIIYFS